MKRKWRIVGAIGGLLLFLGALAWKMTRPPFLGTWIKGYDVLSFNSDGTYLSGTRTGENDSAKVGRWKVVGRHTLEMDGTKVDWKLSEDGKAMLWTVTMPAELQGLFGSEPRSAVFTRR